jgi:hypothetical protein
MNIYVGNLSYEVTEEDLRQAFEQSGQVESVSIINDKYSGRSKGGSLTSMRPGLELKIEGIEVDMVVEEEAGVVKPHMVEVEALAAIIKADMAATEVGAAGEDRDQADV